MSFRDLPAAADEPAKPAVPADPGPASAEPEPAAAATNPGPAAPAETAAPQRNMLPARGRRRLGAERVLVRIIATCGIIAIGVVIAAIMVSSHSQGWITGLVVATVSVVLSAILWSSRQV
jgi:uncharacterized membrane protein